jgi:hypothetical protein
VGKYVLYEGDIYMLEDDEGVAYAKSKGLYIYNTVEEAEEDFNKYNKK